MSIEFVDHSTVELIKTNASDQDVALAAWVSTFAAASKDRDTTNIAGLINFLYRESHATPFEHGSFTFLVDTPIFVSREYLRHRTWSYNETSSRYKQLEPRMYLPNKNRPLVQTGKVGAYKHVPGTDEQYDLLVKSQEKAFQAAWDSYEEVLAAGIAREVARNVLPLATMTQFYATANPWNVLKFFILRSEENALYEIREVSKLEEAMFKEAMPITYAAFEKNRDTWRRVRKLLEEHSIEDLERLAHENTMLKAEVAALGSALLELQQEFVELKTGKATTLHAKKRKGLLF